MGYSCSRFNIHICINKPEILSHFPAECNGSGTFVIKYLRTLVKHQPLDL